MKLLSPKDYAKVNAALQRVSFNNLFARSVVEHQISGQVFVDNTEAPESFYIVHPYGMSLLLGRSDDPVFNAAFKEHALNTNKSRNKHEWMQAYPNKWHLVLCELFGDKLIANAQNTGQQQHGIVELNSRVNFKFNIEKYQAVSHKSTAPGVAVVETDRELFRKMEGSVTPNFFWDSEDDFLANGKAFSLLDNNQLAATAFSAYMTSDKLELGIETLPAFRGKGYAAAVSAALIDFCISNNYEPLWSCRLENTGSVMLAQKLGFEVALTFPYYRLSN
ncbi:GNAT family N-acetyltransferase [Filimonas effusa]|uniref:GNAT family N-acetyltransferase n=1 Tax=Filimonas effusa TaxID=2508721 RepID=A0A4Q1D3G0_9BACT|nr:GNAT family N-acetyltransferase [Filimonas effusa]RXK81703.1 GNAT family N-acetyltransferase [Filimonas effusa]